MPDAPHDLKWNIDLRLASHAEKVPTELRGKPVAGNSLIWTGDPEAGRKYLDHALSLCSPASIRSSVLPFLKLQTMADSDFPHGRRYYTKSGYFKNLDDTTIDRLVAAVSTIPSSETQIEFAYLGGAAGQVAANETPLGDLGAPFIMNLPAHWAEPVACARNFALGSRLVHRL